MTRKEIDSVSKEDWDDEYDENDSENGEEDEDEVAEQFYNGLMIFFL